MDRTDIWIVVVFTIMLLFLGNVTKEDGLLASGKQRRETAEIKGGVGFNDDIIVCGEPIEYTIDNSVVEESSIKKYEWLVGETVVSTSGVPYIPTESDVENTITLKIIMNNNSCIECSAYYSILPVLYIDSDVEYENVEGEYVKVDFNLTDEDYKDEQLYDGKAEIRVRGNSTALLEKKPFKIKLDTKADIFGYGESKHWVLLANAIDASLVRNKLLQDLAGDLGLDNMESELVSLVYNGKYQGVYELSEHVRVESARVDIFDWEKVAEDAAKVLAKSLRETGIISKEEYEIVKCELEDDLIEDFTWVESPTHEFVSSYMMSLGKPSTYIMTDYVDFDSKIPEITGGVLLEMDFLYEMYSGRKTNVSTAYALPLRTNTPDLIKFNALVDYINVYVQSMEYALHSTDFVFEVNDIHYAVDEQGVYETSDFPGGIEGKRVGVTYKEVDFEHDEYHGWHYTDFIDIDSAINNMILCEVALNWDSMKNSFFMYKDIDGKMIFGPVWDFDWAWGNGMGWETNFPETWQTTNEWFANEHYYQTVQWNRLFIRDPYFLVKLYERYHEVRNLYIEPLVNVKFTQMAENNQLAGIANDARWGTAFRAAAGENYPEQIEYTQKFLNRRLSWLDEQFESVDTLIESLGYYIISNDIKVREVDTLSENGYTIITVEVSNDDIAKVSFQVNGKNFYIADVKEENAMIKVPDEVLVQDDSLNVVQFRAMDIDGEYLINENGTIKGNYINAISNYTTFTKTVSGGNDVNRMCKS